MFTDKEREEIRANLGVIQAEFLKAGIKFMPWLLAGMISLIILELFFMECK